MATELIHVHCNEKNQYNLPQLLHNVITINIYLGAIKRLNNQNAHFVGDALYRTLLFFPDFFLFFYDKYSNKRFYLLCIVSALSLYRTQCVCNEQQRAQYARHSLNGCVFCFENIISVAEIHADANEVRRTVSINAACESKTKQFVLVMNFGNCHSIQQYTILRWFRRYSSPIPVLSVVDHCCVCVHVCFQTKFKPVNEIRNIFSV